MSTTKQPLYIHVYTRTRVRARVYMRIIIHNYLIVKCFVDIVDNHI